MNEIKITQNEYFDLYNGVRDIELKLALERHAFSVLMQKNLKTMITVPLDLYNQVTDIISKQSEMEKYFRSLDRLNSMHLLDKYNVLGILIHDYDLEQKAAQDVFRAYLQSGRRLMK